MNISFVIPAYNEERLLPRCLDAIRSAAAELDITHEVIVADDGSTDATSTIALEWGARVIQGQNRQIAATRNLGASIARHDGLVFVDADTRINAAVLKSAIEVLKSGRSGGARVSFDPPYPRLAGWLVRISERAYFLAGRWAAGCFVFCPRQSFEAVGGFDEKLYGGEEIYLSRALRKQGGFVIVPERVRSSARKLRMYSLGEHLVTLSRLLTGGPAVVRKRRNMQMWYDGRRED